MLNKMRLSRLEGVAGEGYRVEHELYGDCKVDLLRNSRTNVIEEVRIVDPLSGEESKYICNKDTGAPEELFVKYSDGREEWKDVKVLGQGFEEEFVTAVMSKNWSDLFGLRTEQIGRAFSKEELNIRQAMDEMGEVDERGN
jgi:hypothetical protein